MFYRKGILLAVATLGIAMASTIEKAEASVCINPLRTICDKTQNDRIERADYVSKLKSEIYQEAGQSALLKVKEMENRIKFPRLIKRALEKMRINNQEVMIVAKKRISGFESVVTNPENIDKIKNYMYKAIDTSSFAMETKENFKGVIKTIIVGNFSDFIEKENLENDFSTKMNACGQDGLVVNAFAMTVKNKRYVFICPGLLITLSQTTSPSERFNRILHILSHEMGHHIDNSHVGNGVYIPYMNCLANNYAYRLNKTKVDEKFCEKSAKDPSECNRKVVLSHTGEMIADQWGIRTTVAHIESEAYSYADADQMLTDSWMMLCGTQDEGIHPSGKFRIEILMRKNPDISGYLACAKNESDVKPACTFAGDVAI